MTAVSESGTRARVARATGAVVWIDAEHARVARSGVDRTRQIVRGLDPQSVYLSDVVRAVGDAERVLILGPGFDRLALEREYVGVYRRPDRLVDVEPSGVVDDEALVARLRELEG